MTIGQILRSAVAILSGFVSMAFAVMIRSFSSSAFRPALSQVACSLAGR